MGILSAVTLATEDRRGHEQRLVREYHEALAAAGVRGFDWEECWEGYRRASFLGIVMTVAPAMPPPLASVTLPNTRPPKFPVNALPTT